jgi:hypothetical protein
MTALKSIIDQHLNRIMVDGKISIHQGFVSSSRVRITNASDLKPVELQPQFPRIIGDNGDDPIIQKKPES